MRAAAAAGAPLDRIVEDVLERSGLRDAFVREGTFEAQGRVENLDEMVRVAAEYEATEDERHPRRASSRGSRCRPTPTWSTSPPGR